MESRERHGKSQSPGKEKKGVKYAFAMND